MPAVALSRVAARVVESGPGGEDLTADAWQRLEALSDPRSPRGGSTQQAKTLARDRLRAVAVDGKTARGARRADGTRVHLLGAAEHGGHLLDHLEVDVKHNETSHLTALLEPGPWPARIDRKNSASSRAAWRPSPQSANPTESTNCAPR
jgi:hypothetical protein